MSEEFSLTKSVELKLSAQDAFDLVANGRVFERTGADSIRFQFAQGGAFDLSFAGRGRVSGVFESIVPRETICLTWNVNGFGRPDEFSRVEFWFKSQLATRTHLEVRHRQILSGESQTAKDHAWSAILSEL